MIGINIKEYFTVENIQLLCKAFLFCTIKIVHGEK